MQTVHLVGGEDAAGVLVERIAGEDRTRTATALADVLLSRFGFTSSTVLLARGEGFPYSLAAGPRGGTGCACPCC